MVRGAFHRHALIRQPPHYVDSIARWRAAGLVAADPRSYPPGMDNPAIARLEAAIGRIERAVETRRTASAAVEQRHATLKARMTEAVTALDQILKQGGAD
jgi:hypothetical protein